MHLADAVKSTCLDQHFYVLSVHSAKVNAVEKVEDVFERTVLLTLGNDGVGGCLAHAADGLQTETYLPVAVDGKVCARLVDRGCKHGDVVLEAVVHKLGNALYVFLPAGHHGGHIFGGVVCFEVGGLVGHP